MTEHLPECCVGPNGCNTEPCQRCHACCICDALRSCEERVLAEDERWIKASTEANHRIAYRLGHDAGLDAARVAVAALPEYRMRDTCIAAIDELREEKK